MAPKNKRGAKVRKTSAEEKNSVDPASIVIVDVDAAMMWTPAMPTAPPDGFCRSLVLWENTIVCINDKAGFEAMFKESDMADHDVCFLGCVKRRGGAIDAFFWVHESDITKFATRRFRVGQMGLGHIRWFSDVYFNNQQANYPADFIAAFPEEAV